MSGTKLLAQADERKFPGRDAVDHEPLVERAAAVDRKRRDLHRARAAHILEPAGPRGAGDEHGQRVLTSRRRKRIHDGGRDDVAPLRVLNVHDVATRLIR